MWTPLLLSLLAIAAAWAPPGRAAAARRPARSALAAAPAPADEPEADADTMYRLRFDGVARALGADAAARLRAAHVCVVGLGGVGSWAVEALARSGVGALTLVDLDEVCVSNTNRQLHALRDSVGRPKADVLAERVAAINPACAVRVVADFVTAANADALVGVGADASPPYDVVLDAVDGFDEKAAIVAAAARARASSRSAARAASATRAACARPT